MSGRRFAELRHSEIPERVGPRSILIQPVGAIEQHGPHLPLITDELIAGAAAEALVDSYGDELDLFVLPSLAYSKSNEHAWAPGSIWQNPQTMLAVLDDLGRSLAASLRPSWSFSTGTAATPRSSTSPAASCGSITG